MKRFLSNILPAIPIAFILGSMMFSHSCANTTTPPTGGPKDTIPPVIVDIMPYPGTVNVPLNTKIAITFDEYVTVKDGKSIVLSPPQKKQPKYKMKGKTLVVYFEEPLNPETTYTLDLTNAIADNNEGNMFPGYTLTFSTGEHLDSMVMTGTILDCNTLNPVKGATVMLYKDHSDSALFKHRPDAAVKTDEWGYFALRNIQDTSYRLYAIMDEAGNFIYDQETDKIAFADSPVHPTMVVSDTLKELLKYNMKDTLHCMARKSEYELLMFKEKSLKQMIVNKSRVADRYAYVTFMAENAAIDSVWVGGYPSSKLIMQFDPNRDSLEIWINDRRRTPDTLHVFVDYLKTDSTGTLAPNTEHLTLYMENAGSVRKSSRRNLKHEDTICVVKLNAAPDLVEQKGFEFEFAYPIINEGFDSVILKSINPRQQETLMKFSVNRDSSNLRKFNLMPKDRLLAGYEYRLKVPQRVFRDINGFYNDSTEVKVSLPKDDKLSTLTLSLTNVKHRYIVDLLDESRKKTLRSYVVDSDSDKVFPYLKAGKFSIRITEDLNGNGLVDTGNLLLKKQPEKVKFFKLRNGSYVISIPEASETVQGIDVGNMFKD